MIITDKALTILLASARECEQAIGTEYANVYTAKHLATLETILELAEDSNVGQITITVPVVVKAEQVADEPVAEEDEVEIEEPEEPTAPMGDLTTDPDQVEVAEPEPKPKRTEVDHTEIVALSKQGMKPTEIAKRLGVGYNTVWRHLKFERDMEAK